ncbi:uncharacterized protein V6R79_022242 [Siganus canaliculatus]
MKMFCRSDQKIICFLCSIEEHKDHDTVPAAAERTERQRALEGSRHNIQQKIQEREKDLKLLQQEVKAMTRSADKTVEDSQMIFTQMISLLEQRRRDVEQQVRSKQEAETIGAFRVGVYLDQGAGVLAFYSVSETMTLLHRVQTRFPQDLHAGLGLCGFITDTVEFCPLKQ